MSSYNTLTLKQNVKIRRLCRICKKRNLLPILNLGKTPLADLFITNPKIKEKKFPLSVSVCKSCFLVQLDQDINDELLFGDNYAFYTGGSPSSLNYFKTYAEEVIRKFPNQSKMLTLEIASNDGTLLKHFKNAKCNILGVDPAKNVVDFANKNNIKTIREFFSEKSSEKIKNEYGKAGIIIANNVFAHVTDPWDFLKGVKNILSNDGVAIIEFQYFPYLLFNNQFDNVYHEHRSFFSITPLNICIKKLDLKIIDIEEHDTQGGSVRVFIAHKNTKIKSTLNVNEVLKNENEIGISDLNTYKGFSSRVNYIKYKLIKILDGIKKENKTILGYGASAKSNTLLNFCGIDTKYLDSIADKTPYKIGKFTPGTHIPVIDNVNKEPDYYLLLVWNYAPSILKREEKFRKNGGKFIIPIPTPYIV